MNWTDEEVENAEQARRAARPINGVVSWQQQHRAIMTRAVELAAARGVAPIDLPEGFDDVLHEMETRGTKGEVQAAITIRGLLASRVSQGATVTALHAERDEWEAKWTGATQNEAKALSLAATLQAKVEEMEQRLSGYEVANTGLRAEVERLTPLARDTEESRRATAKAWQEVERLKAPLPTELHLAVDARLRANRLSPEQVRHGLFQLGMVQRWMERAVSSESRLAASRETKFKCQHGHSVDVAGMFPDEGDAPNSPGIPDGSGVPTILNTCVCGEVLPDEHCLALRHPCSPTCTHDDAVTPGHPERVKEMGEAMWAIVAPDAKCYAPKHINCPCGWDPPQTCHYPTPDGEPTEAAWKEAHELQKAYDRGAEAMRAACLTEVLDACATFGLGPAFRDAVRKAIEGATP